MSAEPVPSVCTMHFGPGAASAGNSRARNPPAQRERDRKGRGSSGERGACTLGAGPMRVYRREPHCTQCITDPGPAPTALAVHPTG
mmetsp:Transcript_43221/g.77684  ORF Transcript_43221/g.77684 Transcript_43221/m.77684 type:complete len:86 (+) Transcript_43221:47-304(+)